VILPDVNVLVYAMREDAPDHSAYRQWLDDTISNDAQFAVADLVLSGAFRVLTHPRIFSPPTPRDLAWTFIAGVRERPNCTIVSPGPRHWKIFTRLCDESGAKGNLVTDAYLAAVAIESGCEWITADRDFARFPGLRWRHPLAPR
jgi:toxin-antitoxin system PIN domain toxin